MKTETTLLTFAEDDTFTFTNVEQEVLKQEEVYRAFKGLSAEGNHVEAKAFLKRNVELFLNEKAEGKIFTKTVDNAKEQYSGSRLMWSKEADHNIQIIIIISEYLPSF